MNVRTPAILSTIANTFCDFTLDIAINKYNMYKILFGTSIGSCLLQIVYGLFIGFEISKSSILVVLLYGLIMLIGYTLYVLSLKKLPVALTGLIESGSLFGFLFIDAKLGYFNVTPYFIFLFIIFLFSIFLYSSDSIKHKSKIKNKTIQLSGIVLLVLSMIMYGIEPYLIKIASNSGANEITINLSYYIFAIPYFYFMLRKNKPTEKYIDKNDNYKLLKIILLISVLESLYYLFGTIGYIGEAPVINAIIQQIRVFLLVILSVIAKTEKITAKKIVAVILGILSVIAIYLY